MSSVRENEAADAKSGNFIRKIIQQDLASGKNGTRVVTRFPPEPNGYLHLGHAKSICLNFGIAADHRRGALGTPADKAEARCHLRFDDTNPENESEEYVAAIQEDIRWLGFDWQEHLYFASDYFDRLYGCALQLIDQAQAYICELSAEQMRSYRGTLTEPGRPSPYRERSVAENRSLFEKMRAGGFADGAAVLRAKIDMASGNINMRDPVLYRVRRAHHIRVGDAWPIYPTYDFTHGLSDAFEGITHSLCTLEFQDHRPLYDWIIDQLKLDHHPQQIEFAPLNINYSVLSKRTIKQMVQEEVICGWNDPRLLTFKGMRRRGYPASGIRLFAERAGVSRKESTIDLSMLEDAVRDELNRIAERRMAVLDPLKVTITDLPEDYEQVFTVPNHPQDESLGTRELPFSRTLWIERSDFMEDAPKKFFRLAPGREVRLRYGYVVRCDEVVKDATGQITELLCSHDASTLGAAPADGRKVKGIIHWVSAAHAVPAEVRLYDRLFRAENPLAGGDFHDHLNPDSLSVNRAALVEASLKNAEPGTAYQFERLGYFATDLVDSKSDGLVLNRTATLRDSWSARQVSQIGKSQ